jgi:hypothetical protein
MSYVIDKSSGGYVKRRVPNYEVVLSYRSSKRGYYWYVEEVVNTQEIDPSQWLTQAKVIELLEDDNWKVTFR